MRLAVIPIWSETAQDIETLANTSNYHMALTHLVEKHCCYERYYHKRSSAGDFVMLDNSLIELGEAMEFSRVIEAGMKIAADEIILPDKMMDGPGTLKAVEEALSNPALHYYEGGVMAVCHGKDLREFFNTFIQLSRIKEIDTIGIPKAVSRFGVTRNEALSRLYLHDCFDEGQKAIHLLGANGYEDFDIPTNLKKRIRGIDTVYPVWMAYHGITLNPVATLNPARPEGKVIHDKMQVKNKSIALNNIAVCLGWANE